MKLKRIILFIIFCVLILFSCDKVYAHSYDISNIEFTVDDYCIVKMSDGNTYLLTPRETKYGCIAYMTSDHIRTYNTIFACASNYSNSALGQLKRYKLVNGKFVFLDYYWYENEILTIDSVFYSTCDIKYINNPGENFFQVPVQEVVVPVLATAEELPQAMITTLTLILPVGLIVFGILLSVYIIRLLILRVT